ncbi:MAG: STAS-like domain-containing protein [Cyanobacteriota bacterium]
MYVYIYDIASDFAEDKDTAAKVRNEQIGPALLQGEDVILDFCRVDLTTQSFIHAMISDVLRTHGEEILDHIEFKNCRPGVQGIIETVIQYSLETLDEDESSETKSG